MLFGLVAGVALGSMVATGTAALALVGAVFGVLVVSAGTWLGRDGDAPRRERAWEAQAVGIAILAAAWLAGMLGESGFR